MVQVRGFLFLKNKLLMSLFVGFLFVLLSPSVVNASQLADGWSYPHNITTYPGFEEGQQFGNTTYKRGDAYYHNGHDFGSAKYPAVAMFAIQGGEVIYSGYYGNGLEDVIVIKNGDFSYIYQEYGTRGSLVSVGQKVKTGDKIGNRTSFHMHLGITNVNWIDAQKDAFNDQNTVWFDPIKVLHGEIDLKTIDMGSADKDGSKKEEDESSYVGESGWKNKMINFENNIYQTTFKGLENQENVLVSTAFVVGLNNYSNIAIKWAYVAMMFITTGIFLFMFASTIFYLVILPKGLGGHKMAQVFEKVTRVDAHVSKSNTFKLMGNMGIATIIIACLYANLLPYILSGIIGFAQIIINFF